MLLKLHIGMLTALLGRKLKYLLMAGLKTGFVTEATFRKLRSWHPVPSPHGK